MVNGGGAFDSLGRVRVGAVVSGSLTNGLEIRLDPATSIEDIKVGSFVTMQGERQRYFGVVTDLELGSTDDSLRLNPPGLSDPLAVRVFAGTAAYGSIRVEPMLTVGADTDDGPQPAKTIPPHFSEVSLATEEDIQDVFGEEGPGHFWIGNPLDMETRLCLNIAELVKRSNGVFGKSGTGKTFLTRLLLMGILQSGQATNLVFDMQSEYGWMGYSEANRQVKGLKQIFESRVAVFSLDEESSRRRGLSPDYVVRIGFDEVEADDVRMLRESLNLSEVAADASFELERHLGKNWLKKFLDHEGGEAFQELASMLNVNQAALSSLKRRLARLERFGFMDDRTGHNSVNRILDYLGRGMHVVLEFGRYGNDISAYILVANLITRRIYDRYQELTERASGDDTQKPTPLVVTIEEAHKFLTRELAGQTIFGNIAREMRKYNVTLLVVDQRPSGIDDEVMSQLGTKITCLLDNERDVDAVLTGVSGSRKLRSVLSKLDSRQQALAFGHALPMPVVFRTREYGTEESYREFGFRDEDELQAQTERDIEELFGPSRG